MRNAMQRRRATIYAALVAAAVTIALQIQPQGASTLQEPQQEEQRPVTLRSLSGQRVLLGQPLRVRVILRPPAVQVVAVVRDGEGIMPHLATRVSGNQYELVFRDRGGSRRVRALARDHLGNVYRSNELRIDVEPTGLDAVTRIESLTTGVLLNFPGDSGLFQVHGRNAAGDLILLEGASELILESGNPAVATIVGENVVATGPGATVVTARFRSLLLTAQVRVESAARGDFTADGQINVHDERLLDAYIGERPWGAFDTRDLNQDGRINQDDLLVLKTLCTSTDCAVH